MSRWRTIRIHSAERHPFGDVPRRPGVYAIRVKGQIVYVGKSDTNVCNRLKSHIQPTRGGLWTCPPTFAFHTSVFEILVTTDRVDVCALERRLIQRINPLANTQHRTGEPMWFQWAMRQGADLRSVLPMINRLAARGAVVGHEAI